MAVAISSRKIVPPSAWAKRPSRSTVAPVNAPATWPNSSLSRSDSDRLPQATSTKRPLRRPLMAWISRARSDFPVPLSPVRRIVTPVSATRRAMSSTRRIAGSPPRIATRSPGAARTGARPGSTSGDGVGQAFVSASNSRSSAAGKPIVRSHPEGSAWGGRTATSLASACRGGSCWRTALAPRTAAWPTTTHASHRPRETRRRASSALPAALACHPWVQSQAAVPDAARRSASMTTTRPRAPFRSAPRVARLVPPGVGSGEGRLYGAGRWSARMVNPVDEKGSTGT